MNSRFKARVCQSLPHLIGASSSDAICSWLFLARLQSRWCRPHRSHLRVQTGFPFPEVLQRVFSLRCCGCRKRFWFETDSITSFECCSGRHDDG